MRLKEKYKKQIVPKMEEKFGFKNDMLVPRLTKVVLNVGFGHHAKEKEYGQRRKKSGQDRRSKTGYDRRQEIDFRL